MAIITTLFKPEEGEPLKADKLKAFLAITHDNTPIMIKIGDAYYNIREIRQVTDPAVGPEVMKVFVPVDPTIVTK